MKQVEMRFAGGPLDSTQWERVDAKHLRTWGGYKYTLAPDGLWHYAGDGGNCFVRIGQEEVEMMNTGSPLEWHGWTIDGMVRCQYVDDGNGKNVFRFSLPDGRTGNGSDMQEALDAAQK
jgi:hypothetical protein